MVIDIVKVFFPAIISFVIGVLITPVVSDFLYRNKMWKKKSGKVDFAGNATPIFNSIHKDKEVSTPRMGGSIIWLSAIFTAILIAIVSYLLPSELSSKLSFLSRDQTWIPFATLLIGAFIGLIDDYLEVSAPVEKPSSGLSLRKRLFAVTLVRLACG